MKIVTWNLAGGRKIKSSKEFDYQEEDLQYFIEILQKQNSDILCLQETHRSNNYVMSEKIAKALHIKYVFNSSTHPSHIDPKSRIGNAILSKFQFTKKTNSQFMIK